jgi:hypothetical protein
MLIIYFHSNFGMKAVGEWLRMLWVKVTDHSPERHGNFQYESDIPRVPVEVSVAAIVAVQPSFILI